MNYVYYPDYLEHHGVLGQKWGIRRYQNEDGSWTKQGLKHRKEFTNYKEEGGDIKKGSTLYRVGIDPSDRTYDNKKYVSTSKLDNELWEEYLAPRYKATGRSVYALKYETIDNIKVANETKLGEAFVDRLSKFPQETMNDTERSYRIYNLKLPNETTFTEAASMNMAAQTETGKKMVEYLLNKGYGAVTDTHGTNTSIDPVIVLSPEDKLKLTSMKRI